MTTEQKEVPAEVRDYYTFAPKRMTFRKEKEKPSSEDIKLIFVYDMLNSQIINVYNQSDDEYKKNIIANSGIKAWFDDCAQDARRKVMAALAKSFEKIEADYREGLVPDAGSEEELPDEGVVDYN